MPALIQGPLGDYGIARSLIQTPGWNPLEHTDARGNPAGGKKRGGGFSISGGGGGSSPLDPYGSGLEGLNDLNQFPIPTYSQDPFYYQNVMNQQQNMDPNGYWTGPKEHKPIVKVNGEWKFLENLTPEDKAWVANTSEMFGEGIGENFLADPAQDAYNLAVASGTNWDKPQGYTVDELAGYDANAELDAINDTQGTIMNWGSAPEVTETVWGSSPVQEYANYDTGYVGTGNYSGMSFGL
jgi:hypothetical protein